MQGVPKRGRADRRNPEFQVSSTDVSFTCNGGLVVAQRAGPRPGLFRLFRLFLFVVVVEAPEEAGADVWEALPGHAHVPLPDAEGLHEQLGGVLQVFHRNLGESKRDG